MGTFCVARYAAGITVIGVLVSGCGGQTVSGGIPVASPLGKAPHEKTFRYTGGSQSFKVPAGVTSIAVVARGAAGAGETLRYSGKTYYYFGLGGRVHATIPVRPGETLYVLVGGQGSSQAGGFNGGGLGGAYPYCGGSSCFGYGGGGSSDVREGGNGLSDRILIAGGGGGEGTARETADGGAGGGEIGGNGGGSYYRGMGGGGTGGTQSAGGSGGTGGIGIGSEPNGGPGNPGALGIGGSGGFAGYNPYPSGYNTGGAGGGGGGGYYGAGGGGGGGAAYASIYGAPGAGGGGGSSYVESRAKKVSFWRGWKNATGNGLVVFSWQ